MAAFTALALIVAACAPSESPTPTPKDTATSTPAAPTELTIALGPIGLGQVDPLLAQRAETVYLRLLYAPLIGMNLLDTEICPCDGLAQEWNWSDDGLSLTVTLREGARFHNGEEVTAEDVKFSLERLRGDEAGAGNFVWAPTGPIDQIEAVDRYTVVFHATGDVPNLNLVPVLSALAGQGEPFIIPMAYFEEVGEDGFRAAPVGAGPYRLISYESGSFMEFEAFEDYFLGSPSVARITLREVPEESTRVAMLQSGEADIADIARERAAELRDADFNVFTKPGGTLIHLFTQIHVGQDHVFTPGVREALFLAIDREAILESLLAGEGFLTGNIAWEGIGASPIDPHAYDLERAEELLRDEGYGPGELQLTLYIALKASLPEITPIGEFIAASWESIGVTTEIVPMEFNTLRDLVRGSEALANPGVDVPSLRLHDIDTRAFMADLMQVAWSCEWQQFIHACDPEFDSILADALAATTIEEYEEAIQTAAEYAHDNYLSTVIAGTGKVFATNEKVQEWDLGSTSYSHNYRYLFLRGLLD